VGFSVPHAQRQKVRAQCGQSVRMCQRTSIFETQSSRCSSSLTASDPLFTNISNPHPHPYPRLANDLGAVRGQASPARVVAGHH
jgi:hypothetical protein